MSLVSAIVTFAIMWWLVFFMVLPFGVRTAEEAGEALEPGQAPSAPVRPRLWLKVGVTTLLTAVFFAVFYTIVASDLVDFRAYLEAGRDG